jgi:pentatricopeptide repeat protein
MIAAYSKQGYDQEALALFRQMQEAGFPPNHFTFASILPACTNLVDLKKLHYEITRSGFQSNVYVGNALVDRYAKCGSTEDARGLFDKMTQRNVVSWTSMISGYTGNGQYWEALKLFRQMQLTCVKPNTKTLTSLLPACANLAALERGMEVHGEIIRSGFHSDVFVMNALVDMYAKCGSMEDAHDAFDKMYEWNAVSWTTMVAGYAQNGRVEEAHKFFQKMPEKDVLSWTALIGGYAQNGHGQKALRYFREMQLAGVKPNSKTFACVLPACASLVALEQGKEIHEEIIKRGLVSDVFVGSAIIDMYAKCGNIEGACNVFDRMTVRDVVSWTVMIVGCARHGLGKEALKIFERMQHSGSKPDHVTFLGVLSACCHAGLVDEGQQYFDSMSRYCITPKMDHYSCIVDLLGRAGLLNEAEAFIHKMPIKPDSFVWGCLLAACRVHTNIEIAKSVAEHLFELNPKNDTTYVLLSNIYAAVGRWDASEKVRKLMDDKGINKNPGCSWIEVNKQVYAFLMGDKLELQTQQIYAFST